MIVTMRKQMKRNWKNANRDMTVKIYFFCGPAKKWAHNNL
jgi:hypothetical protein